MTEEREMLARLLVSWLVRLIYFISQIVMRCDPNDTGKEGTGMCSAALQITRYSPVVQHSSLHVITHRTAPGRTTEWERNDLDN